MHVFAYNNSGQAIGLLCQLEVHMAIHRIVIHRGNLSAAVGNAGYSYCIY